MKQFYCNLCDYKQWNIFNEHCLFQIILAPVIISFFLQTFYT